MGFAYRRDASGRELPRHPRLLMLRLLRNMKMSTKLFTVLAAPVAVLLLLSIIGVTSRRAEANDAHRVEQLSEFVQVDSNLVDELQKEAIWSAAYMSTIDENLNVDQARKDEYSNQLDAQREKTDAALAAYTAAVAKIDPGRDNPAAAEAVKQAQNRLDNLKTSRTSVTEIQAIPVNAVTSFAQITTSLIDVNSSLGAERQRRRAAPRSDHGRQLRASEGSPRQRSGHPHLRRGARRVQQPGRRPMPERQQRLRLVHGGDQGQHDVAQATDTFSRVRLPGQQARAARRRGRSAVRRPDADGARAGPGQQRGAGPRFPVPAGQLRDGRQAEGRRRQRSSRRSTTPPARWPARRRTRRSCTSSSRRSPWPRPC